MSEHDEFMRGFCDGSGLELGEAIRAYADWLEREGYGEIYRIDLESGGYAGGLEVGQKWRDTNPQN
jgi:hypothetical protein